MKNKITHIFVMLFVMMFAFSVKADWSPYLLTKDKDNNSYYYDRMPTEVKKGDIITVKVSFLSGEHNAKINEGRYYIGWDEKAFEIVETDGRYYTLKNENIEVTQDTLDRNNKYSIWFEGNDTTYNSDYNGSGIPLFEFKFRVLDNVKDGIYEIYQTEGEGSLSLDSAYLTAYENILRYQVGKDLVKADYTPTNLSSGSYVIGNHLFTRDGSDEYNGILTTDYIMLASKSIESDKKDDMIVYVKSAKGGWKNAITDNEVIPPENFNITYVNMIPSYQYNGLYSNSIMNYTEEDYFVLAVTQINDKKAIVSIESNGMTIHGIGNVNKNVITFNLADRNYKITINNNEANIETNDTNIKETNVSKKTNYGINDYYREYYGISQYLKSSDSGIYALNDKEIYYAKVRSNIYLICIKEKNNTKCVSKSNEYANLINGNPGTFSIGINDKSYNLVQEDDKIILSSNNDNAYAGTYTKQSNITMEDIFSVEENYINYVISYRDNDDSYINSTMVSYGDKLDEPNVPTKDGYKFVEWQLDGVKYDFSKPVTKPMKLVAKWEVDIKTPVLTVTVNPTDSIEQRYYLFIDDENYCVGTCALLNADREYKISGYKVYEIVNGKEEEIMLESLVDSGQNGDEYIESSTFKPYEWAYVTQEPLIKRTYVVRAYILDDNNQPVYSDYSNEVEIDTTYMAPELGISQGHQDGSSYVGYERDTKEYVYDFGINSADYLLAEFGNVPSESDVYRVYKAKYYDIFEKNGKSYKFVTTSEIDTAATVKVAINQKKTFVARAYIYNSNGEKAYSEFSNEILIDTTLKKPTLHCVLANNELNGTNGYGYDCSVSNVFDDYFDEGSNTLIVENFEVYEKVNGEYQSFKICAYGCDDQNNWDYAVGEVGGVVGVIEVEPGTKRTFVARVYTEDSQGNTIYSEYSDELELDWTRYDAPIISRSVLGAGEVGDENVPQPLNYDSEKNAFEVMIAGDYSIHVRAMENAGVDEEGNPAAYISIITDYEYFDENDVSVYDGGFGGEANLYIPIGSKKSFVAKAYTLNTNNQKIYSEASNKITIDLTNPVYTFETIIDENVDDKVILRTYINNYEMGIESVIINNNEYPVVPNFPHYIYFDKAIFENQNEITLKLADDLMVTATRKTN